MTIVCFKFGYWTFVYVIWYYCNVVVISRTSFVASSMNIDLKPIKNDYYVHFSIKYLQRRLIFKNANLWDFRQRKPHGSIIYWSIHWGINKCAKSWLNSVLRGIIFTFSLATLKTLIFARIVHKSSSLAYVMETNHFVV